MFKIKIISDKSFRSHLLVFRNYKRVDQIAKSYLIGSNKSKIVTFNISKLKFYVKKGLNFYNKKLNLLNLYYYEIK